jgi:hypothetical protein
VKQGCFDAFMVHNARMLLKGIRFMLVVILGVGVVLTSLSFIKVVG